MTEDNKLADLQSAWKKMEESEATSKKAPLVEATAVSTKFGVKDTNSKPVKPNPNDMGSVAGHKEVGDDHGTKKPVEGANPIKREQGSVAGHKEVGDDHGTKKAVEGANPVDRKEGSKASVQKYADFRAKIKSVLGLSLTDPLNATGKGLNK